MSWHPPCHPMAPKAWAKGAGTPAFLSRFQVPDLTAFHSTWSSPLEGTALTFLVWISPRAHVTHFLVLQAPG